MLVTDRTQSSALSEELLERCASRAAGYDRDNRFFQEDFDELKAWVEQHGAPVVVKADGLAAGKGVVVAHTVDEALAAGSAMLEASEFGAAGSTVVVEDFLEGEEASFIAMVGVDGAILPLATSQDHKAREDGDRGPNTGGMGAYSPAPVVTAAIADFGLAKRQYSLSDGRQVETQAFHGMARELFEVYKVVGGKVTAVEAVSVDQPYGMPAAWVTGR